MSLKAGDLVEHKTDFALGQGRVKSVDKIAGRQRINVRWTSRLEQQEHTADQLNFIPAPPARLVEAGIASRVPFQLKVLGRWFEARHALTGELSNQPFQMLPHQVVVTNKVVNSAPDNRAWLIADDVGLGKTIEAGMIMEVLRKKSLGRFRCLIVTPAGLMPQWKDELAIRFRRHFRIFESRIPNDLDTVDQLLASVDTLKGARFKDAIATVPPWDLVIFDEAHHLATTPSVLTYQLAQHIRAKAKARNILFLSATPHSGNNEHFFNMLRLLREDLFPKGAKDFPNVPLKNVMIRNRKSEVTDVAGHRIFKGIAPARIIEFSPHADEVAFYEELRTYLRTGYKVVDKLQKAKDGQRASAVGFLMSTFGKLASSSRAAIESALNNRRQALLGESDGGTGGAGATDDTRFPGEAVAQAVAETGLEEVKGKKRKVSPIEGELTEVEGLLAALRSLSGPDSKLASFLAHVEKLDRDVKLLIFTEYRATQAVLVPELEARFGKDCVAVVHGSMDMGQRRQQVHRFNEHIPNPRFMVSTEAGGEGLNMQKSCHTVVNYDLPWNPMALQQRIGRVYRYGQKKPVVVFNLKVDSTSEAFADQRVYEYLERKIDEITKKLREVQDGHAEDIRGEVLGQVAAQIGLDELYKTAVEEGRQRAERAIDSQTGHIQEILSDPNGMLGIFRGLDRFDITDYQKVAARVTSEQLEFFVKQYLGREGAPPAVSADGLLTFTPPKALIEVAGTISKADPYKVYEQLTSAPIQRATVDKDRAQTTLNCRLLRFGDVAFESMVRHVQHGGQAAGANGVAILELPAAELGWAAGTEGTWSLFDLRVVKQDGSAGVRVLRNELASFLVSHGGAPVPADSIVEHLHNAFDGALSVDAAEASRAYDAARDAADTRLGVMLDEVVAEYATEEGILPQEVQDVGFAWVRAV